MPALPLGTSSRARRPHVRSAGVQQYRVPMATARVASDARLGPGDLWSADASVRGDLSLALHRAVVERLRADPDRVLSHARRNLIRLRQFHRDGHSDVWIDRWQALLDGPVDRLVAVMVDPAQDARDLRQSNPFAGVLSPQEHRAIIRSTRRD